MSAPKRCAYCGKAAHKAIEQLWNPYVSGTIADREKLTGTKETWNYTGNKIVIRKSITNPGEWGSNDKPFIHWVSVWDGETWALSYDPFCTLRCAEGFARAAFRAGYRMTKD